MWLNDFVAAGHFRDVFAFHLDMDVCSFESDLPGWKALTACALSAGASQRRHPPAPGAHWLLPSYGMGFLSHRLLGSPVSCNLFSGFKWLGMSLQCSALVWTTTDLRIPFLKLFKCSYNMYSSFYYTRSFCWEGEDDDYWHPSLTDL